MEEHWTDKWIRYDQETDEYVGYLYDSTELVRNHIRVYVVKSLIEYDERINNLDKV